MLINADANTVTMLACAVADAYAFVDIRNNVRITLRVRNPTDKQYAIWADPGYTDQILLGARAAMKYRPRSSFNSICVACAIMEQVPPVTSLRALVRKIAPTPPGALNAPVAAQPAETPKQGSAQAHRCAGTQVAAAESGRFQPRAL